MSNSSVQLTADLPPASVFLNQYQQLLASASDKKTERTKSLCQLPELIYKYELPKYQLFP